MSGCSSLKRNSKVVSSLLLTSLILSASSQATSIQLTVTEKSYTNKASFTSHDGHHYIRSDVFYVAKILNTSKKPISDVRVIWVVLSKPARTIEKKIFRGEDSFYLAPGSTHISATDIFELARAEKEGLDRVNSSVIYGYVIEVFISGEVVASKIDPPDTKMKIDQLKSSKR